MHRDLTIRLSGAILATHATPLQRPAHEVSDSHTRRKHNALPGSVWYAAATASGGC